MTDDQLIRAAVTGGIHPRLHMVNSKAKAHLSAKRNESGRGLIERIGYRLGKLWAAGYSAAQKASHRR